MRLVNAVELYRALGGGLVKPESTPEETVASQEVQQDFAQ